MIGWQASTVLVVGLLHCCSPEPTLNTLAGLSSVTVTEDLAYADGARHTLDVYRPARPGSAPIVVFLYGGAWRSGTKAMYRFIGTSLAEGGAVVVIPDYRLYPAVRFPGFMEDAARAVGWTHANAARFGGDPRRMFLVGHSAGAQIATLLAMDDEHLHAVQLVPERDICGVVGLAGLYDFLPGTDEEVRQVFGPKANWARAQPGNFAAAHAPGMLLLAGSADRTVDPRNTLQLAARLRAAGAGVRGELLWGISHTAIIAAIAPPLVFLAPVRERLLDFVATRDCSDSRAVVAPAAGQEATRRRVPG